MLPGAGLIFPPQVKIENRFRMFWGKLCPVFVGHLALSSLHSLHLPFFVLHFFPPPARPSTRRLTSSLFAFLLEMQRAKLGQMWHMPCNPPGCVSLSLWEGGHSRPDGRSAGVRHFLLPLLRSNSCCKRLVRVCTNGQSLLADWSRN